MCPSTSAQDEAGILEEVKKLQKEGTEQFNVAGNTDLSRGERNKALKAAYIVLRKAQGILDEYVSAGLDLKDCPVSMLREIVGRMRKEAAK